MPKLDDQELLAEFARSQSETAFAALVERYVNLVYSTARRFTGNPHHAEEISQAVFIILVRKAARLSSRTVLSGWLYQTARLASANFMKGEIRRQRREQEAYMQSTLNEPESVAWEQLEPLLDEAMGRLGGTDRDAVVMRYFQNKSAAEVAAALRTTEAAAHKRVNRALEKLRKMFNKRGVTLSAAIIGGALAANSVQAAPVGLAGTVVASAASGSTLAASIAALVKGTLKTMMWLKLKFAAGVSVITLLVGGTAIVAISGDDLQCTSIPIVSTYEGKEVMRGCIISASESVAPGEPFTVGLLLRLQPGWHTYSSEPGDSGTPTSITWQLPEGFTATPLRWPTAKVKTYEDIDVRCNVYENEVLLMTQITPPKDIRSDTILIQATVTWGCDSDRICLMPVNSKVALRLKRADALKPVNAKLFAKHRALVQK